MKLCNCEIKNYPMSLANSAFAHLHNCTILHFRFPNYDPAPHRATPAALASRDGCIIPKSPPKRAKHLPRSLTNRGQSRHRATRPFLSWTAKRKPMEQRNCSCLVKTRFVSGGGAKPADIMGTILFKPNQAFGEGLFFDNRECKERRLANMPTRALAF